MWFKNLQLFQFTEDFTLSPEELAEKLTPYSFKPVSGIESISQGWITPTGEADGQLVHAANGFIMVTLKVEQKVIPAAVVREQLNEKVTEIEARENRKVRKKEKDQLKDEIFHSLLSRAFSKSHTIHAYIDPMDKWLVVNTSSRKKAEEFTETLRRALGSLKVQVPQVQSVSALLTEWLSTEQFPTDYVIEDACVLQDNKDSGSIRCQRQNLLTDEVKSMIEVGREAISLALSWRDQLAFVLKDDFSIRSLRFLEAVRDQANDMFTETVRARFDADFTIMTESLRGFLRSLIAVFGKDNKPTGSKDAAREKATA
jgi:recombination associated protein RdgC